MPFPLCPFEKASHYRVLQDISFLNHKFQKGTEVIFKDYGYTFKEGITRYWFINVGNEDSNAWHVFDSDPQEVQLWQTYFAELK